MLQLQFQQQQAAQQQAATYAGQYGYAPGGNYMTWGQGGPTQPVAGTPTLNAQQVQMGLTSSALQNALAAAGVTGQFAQPQMRYQPGTVLTSQSTTPGLGPAYGVVNSDGSVSMVSAQSLSQLAGARGTTAQAMMSSAQPVDWNTLQSLSQGAPTGPAQQTLAANQQAYNQAATAAGLTGQFVNPNMQPAALLQQGMNMQGQSFYSLPQSEQQYWLQYNQNNPTAAAQAWAQATNGALQAAGYTNPQAAPQQTLQAINQAAILSGMYNGAPTAAYQAQGQQEAQNWAQLYGYTPQIDPTTGQPIAPGAAGLSGVTPGSVVRNNAGQLGIVGIGGMITPGDASNSAIYQALQNPGSIQTLSDQQWTGALGGGPQTLAAQQQQATLSGMYQGAPTEAAREFNVTNALQQGQLGQQYLSTAAQLQGPQNTFQLSNYLRGAAANPNVPVYLQALQNNMGLPSFQGTGQQQPTPASMSGLAAGMGYGAPASTGTGTDTSGGATAGWNYGDTLNAIKGIAQQGGQALAPGSLERLSPDELQAFGSGLGAAGYSLPSFLSSYNSSRVNQQAPVTAMGMS